MRCNRMLSRISGSAAWLWCCGIMGILPHYSFLYRNNTAMDSRVWRGIMFLECAVKGRSKPLALPENPPGSFSERESQGSCYAEGL